MQESLLGKKNKKLLEQICELIKLTIEQHNISKEAVAKGDRELALKVLENDKKIDMLYLIFKANAEFVLTMRPLGKELRRTLAYMEISLDIERLADYAKHISKFVIKQKKINASSKQRIRAVHKAFRIMLEKLEKVVVSENYQAALNLIDEDEFVNKAVEAVHKKILQSVTSKNSQSEIEQRIFVLTVANALERAGDHIVHICRSVCYITLGQPTIKE